MSALSLADAKTHLNITGTTYDAELQTFIDAAEGIVSKVCGPLTPTTVSRRITSNGTTLVVPVVPVISLTSITPLYTAAVSVAGLYVDNESGVVCSLDGRTSFFTAGPYDVVYQAGYTAVPPDLLMAVKEETRHLWKTQRGGGGRQGSTDPAGQAPGYLVPFPVAELMQPHAKTFGFA